MQTRQVYIESEELTILLRVVLLLRVRLYFIFGYITSQKLVKLPSTKVFCEMREGNLIGVDTNEAGALKENDITLTRELGSNNSELSCEFCRCHPIHSDKNLGKSEHSFN